MSDTLLQEHPSTSQETAAAERPPAARLQDPYALGVLCLVLFALLTCVAGLASGPLLGDHECIVAQSARQCVETGNWLIPYLGEIPRIRKTPVGIWIVGLSSRVFDDPAGRAVTAYSARMPSAIAGVLNALAVCWLGSMLFGRRAGLVAGFIAAGCVGTMVYARDAQVDMILTLFTTLSFACFWRAFLANRPTRAWPAAFYVAFAAAMMAKAPLPGAVVGVGLFVFWFVAQPLLGRTEGASTGSGLVRQVVGLRQLWLVPGTLLFLVLAGTWPLYAFFHVENASALWKMEYVDRFSGDLSDRRQAFYYYLPILFGLMVPYMLSVPESLAAPFVSRYRRFRRELVYVFVWAVVGTVFISAAAYKRPHYLLSMVPAYCLLLAPVIDRLFFGTQPFGPLKLPGLAPIPIDAGSIRRLCRAFPVVLFVAAVGGGVAVRMKMPELLRFYPLVALVLFGGLTAACLCFGGGRRALSFGMLQLTVAAAMTLAWPAVGAAMDHNPEMDRLVQGFKENGVGPADPIYWVGSRPDSSIEFYSGYRIRRLINELEMATVRKDRKTVDEDLLRLFADRIRQRLAEPRPVYLIMASGHCELMRRMEKIPCRVLFEVSGIHARKGDDLVVVTQPKPTAAIAATTSGPAKP